MKNLLLILLTLFCMNGVSYGQLITLENKTDDVVLVSVKIYNKETKQTYVETFRLWSGKKKIVLIDTVEQCYSFRVGSDRLNIECNNSTFNFRSSCLESKPMLAGAKLTITKK